MVSWIKSAARKAALGLFDDPYRGTDERREKAVVGSREHIALSREAGRSTCRSQMT